MAETSFPQFSSLPAEIRKMVWELAAFPRIVHLEYVKGPEHKCSRVWSQTSIDGPDSMGFFDMDQQSGVARFYQGPHPPWRFISRSIPPLFWICKESYSVAEKMYAKSFGTQFTFPSTWFNFELDTLHLDWGYDPNEELDEEDEIDMDEIMITYAPGTLSQDVRKVQSLALNAEQYPAGMSSERWLHLILSHFGNVQNLYMVVPPRADEDCANLVFLEKSDVPEDPQRRGERHPVWKELYPDLAWNFRRCLWESSEFLWAIEPYSNVENLSATGNNRFPKWSLPKLHHKPLTSSKRRLKYLQRIKDHDGEKGDRILTVTVTARYYNSLELHVPARTSFSDLATTFYRIRAGTEHADMLLPLMSRFLVAKPPNKQRYRHIKADSKLYSWVTCNDQDMRVDLFTRRDNFNICLCDDISCHHIQKYRELLWMESEDWGVRDLFENFE